MLPLIRIDQLPIFQVWILRIFMSCMVKGLLFYMLALIIVHVVKSMTPDLKHLLWLSVLICMILIPIFILIHPDGLLRVTLIRSPSTGAAQLSEATAYTGYESPIQPIQFSTVHQSQSTAPPLFPWSRVFLAIWFTGIFVSWARVVIGRIKIHIIIKQSRICSDERCAVTAHELCDRLCIFTDVMLYKSTLCRTPFTVGAFSPKILLPSDIHTWPVEKLRAVLTHELAHIRRNDYLSQFISRTICSVFWFVPFVWFAYRSLHEEQEKACDGLVLDQGFEAQRYALDILTVVKTARERALLTGIFICKRRKNMIERRIVNLFHWRQLKNRKKLLLVGGILAASIFFVMPILMFNTGLAEDTEKVLKNKKFEKLCCGTWVNPDYDSDYMYNGKIVLKASGSFKGYNTAHESSPSQLQRKGVREIKKAWVDSDGNYCYLIYAWYTHWNQKLYELHRFTSNGTRWEYVEKQEDWPQELRVEDTSSHVYFRD
jgi:beta-lactamase regulating signal transducer with metallopeptidase domain